MGNTPSSDVKNKPVASSRSPSSTKHYFASLIGDQFILRNNQQFFSEEHFQSGPLSVLPSHTNYLSYDPKTVISCDLSNKAAVDSVLTFLSSNDKEIENYEKTLQDITKLQSLHTVAGEIFSPNPIYNGEAYTAELRGLNFILRYNDGVFSPLSLAFFPSDIKITTYGANKSAQSLSVELSTVAIIARARDFVKYKKNIFRNAADLIKILDARLELMKIAEFSRQFLAQMSDGMSMQPMVLSSLTSTIFTNSNSLISLDESGLSRRSSVPQGDAFTLDQRLYEITNHPLLSDMFEEGLILGSNVKIDSEIALKRYFVGMSRKLAGDNVSAEVQKETKDAINEFLSAAEKKLDDLSSLMKKLRI
jgi:hypothetical protein